MCGISGMLKWNGTSPEDPALLRQMIKSMDHRGPDGKGIYIDDRVGLGHARLSIIDPQWGFQPLSNEDGSLWLVCNGEIFNYIELRSLLRKQGHRFCSKSDVEVILHLYEVFQDDLVEYLNGQYAFALWDRRAQRLLLGRDHVGICPLYYTKLQNGIAFASEVKALFQLPEVPRQLNMSAMMQTLTFWAPIPGESPFQNVHEVKPGHLMSITKERTEEKRYWRPDFSPDPDEQISRPEEAVQILQDVLADAVRIRLRADVPVGAYLSGGLDSSITAALIKTVSPGYLKTFSVGFANAHYDESMYQDQMVKHLQTEHARLLCQDEDMAARLAEVIWHTEKPVLRSAPVPLYMLSQLVRNEGFKVVLTGEGADEFFSGYNIYKETKIRSFIAQQPGSPFRVNLLQRLYPYLDNKSARNAVYWQDYFLKDVANTQDPFYSHRMRWQIGAFVSQFMQADAMRQLGSYDVIADLQSRISGDLQNLSPFARAHALETYLFLPSYLLSSQGDRMLMGHGVEGRYPFLDKRVINLANLMAPQLKLKVLKEKWILKKAFSHLVPPSITSRAKQPYRAPIRSIIETGEKMHWPYLDSEWVKKYNLFDAARVERLKQKFLNPDTTVAARDEMAIMFIITAGMMQERFINGHNLLNNDDIPNCLVFDKRTEMNYPMTTGSAYHAAAQAMAH
jgi:asparagine synthase (glutamine-hydrolysing)